MDRTTYKQNLECEIGKRKFPKSLFIPRGASARAIWMIRTMQFLYGKGRIAKTIGTYLRRKSIREFGMFVSEKSEIGCGLKLPHPNGIVIGSSVRIGKNCTIFQQVTLGNARTGDYLVGNQPEVGDDVRFFAGCKVLGRIHVSDGVIVGANAVVTKDCPPNAVMVGVPARNKADREKDVES